MSNELSIENLRFAYGDRQILSDVTFTISKGMRAGIIGRNGAGKTTMLECVFGVKKPDSGTVRYNGLDVERLHTKKGVVAYLPQFPFLPRKARVRDCIRLYFGKSELAQPILADEIIAPIADTKIFTLSGGEARYLEFLLILHTNAEFIILDEPFSRIAPALVEKMRARIEAQSDKKAFIITDHVYRHIIEFCPEVYILEKGRLVLSQGMDDLRRRGYLPLTEE